MPRSASTTVGSPTTSVSRVPVVPSGVSVGIESSIPDLLSQVGGFLDEGYARIKLKIQPGWDIEPVRAVRERFGDVPLQVDANTAYRLSDAPLLRRLDPFDLLLIEQPLAEDDLRQHALLAQQIADAGLPRRVDRVGRGGCRRDRDGSGERHQHQTGPSGRIPRGPPHP